MIDCRSARKNNCGVIEYINTGIPELFGGNSFNLNKRPEVDFQPILFSQLKIR
jgi:hypothetical protein